MDGARCGDTAAPAPERAVDLDDVAAAAAPLPVCFAAPRCDTGLVGRERREREGSFFAAEALVALCRDALAGGGAASASLSLRASSSVVRSRCDRPEDGRLRLDISLSAPLCRFS